MRIALVMLVLIEICCWTICERTGEPDQRDVVLSVMGNLVGGACLGKNENRDVCTGVDECAPGTGPDAGFWTLKLSTDAVKRWCGVTTGSSSCDCNQTNVPRVACVTQQLCVGGCNSCAPPTNLSTVQTTVNLNGAACTSSAQCDG